MGRVYKARLRAPGEYHLSTNLNGMRRTSVNIYAAQMINELLEGTIKDRNVFWEVSLLSA